MLPESVFQVEINVKGSSSFDVAMLKTVLLVNTTRQEVKLMLGQMSG